MLFNRLPNVTDVLSMPSVRLAPRCESCSTSVSGAPRMMFDVLWCSPRRRVCEFLFGCVLVAASRGANHHGAITLVCCFPTRETVKWVFATQLEEGKKTCQQDVCSVCISMCIFSVCQGNNLRHRSHICHLVIWAHCESHEFHVCSQFAAPLQDRIGRLLA